MFAILFIPGIEELTSTQVKQTLITYTSQAAKRMMHCDRDRGVTKNDNLWLLSALALCFKKKVPTSHFSRLITMTDTPVALHL